jgi:protein-S-isoprenylcysteine O-methyltransferase Ste14
MEKKSSNILAALIAAALVLLVFGPMAMSGGLPLQAPSHKALSITAGAMVGCALLLEAWAAHCHGQHRASPRTFRTLIVVCLLAATLKFGSVVAEIGVHMLTY